MVLTSTFILLILKYLIRKTIGITPDAVLSTLSGYYGGQYVSNFNRFSKVYKSCHAKHRRRDQKHIALHDRSRRDQRIPVVCSAVILQNSIQRNDDHTCLLYTSRCALAIGSLVKYIIVN